MRVRLLGAAAGGAFPQWNCNCANCRLARIDPDRAKPRTQSSVAVSGDGRHWFLINASPDVRTQIESFPPLAPAPESMRGTGIAGILITNADLDHTLGLFVLREGRRLIVHATAQVRRALSQRLQLESVLASYCGIEWREPPTEPAPLLTGDGAPTGLVYSAFAVPGKPPRYCSTFAASPGDAVGFQFVDEKTGGRLVVVPDTAGIDESVEKLMRDADILLFDGTFFDEDEMRTTGAGTALASEMGHIPISGPNGSMHRLATMQDVYRVYVHINNTNPILVEDSPQRAAVEAAGIMVGYDGMEMEIEC